MGRENSLRSPQSWTGLPTPWQGQLYIPHSHTTSVKNSVLPSCGGLSAILGWQTHLSRTVLHFRWEQVSAQGIPSAWRFPDGNMRVCVQGRKVSQDNPSCLEASQCGKKWSSMSHPRVGSRVSKYPHPVTCPCTCNPCVHRQVSRVQFRYRLPGFQFLKM